MRYAIVGTGKRGQGHLRALGCPVGKTNSGKPGTGLQPIPGVRIVAVCDAFDPHRLTAAAAVEAVFGHCSTYVDYREMLEKEDLDAVVIATPDHLHTPVAIAAARAGCDAYVEKSVSNNLGETLELGRVLRETGRIIQVGYQQRQDHIHAQAKSVLAKGHIGQVHMIQTFFNRGGEAGAWISPYEKPGAEPARGQIHWDQFLGNAPRSEYSPERYFGWRRYWDYSTGIFGDVATHLLAMAEDLVDAPIPTSVSAHGGIYHWHDGRETPDQVTASFDYGDRQLQFSFLGSLGNSFPKQSTTFLGEDGTLELDWRLRVYADQFSPKYADRIAAGTLNARSPFIHIEDGAAKLAVKAAPSELWLGGRGATLTTRPDGQVRDTTRLHHEDLADCIRTRNEPKASYERSLGSTIGALLATISYREQRTVIWAEERAKFDDA